MKSHSSPSKQAKFVLDSLFLAPVLVYLTLFLTRIFLSSFFSVISLPSPSTSSLLPDLAYLLPSSALLLSETASSRDLHLSRHNRRALHLDGRRHQRRQRLARSLRVIRRHTQAQTSWRS